MKTPTPFYAPAYTGHRRRPLQVQFIYPSCCTPAPRRTPRISTILPTLLLFLFISVVSVNLTHPALAADLPSTTPTSSTPTADPTYIYISCPVEIYRGTAYANEPAEYLVDDFESLPEHWLYVLTPLDEGESYFFTLDLACRTENSRFEGQISAVYSSYVPDDGSLGSVRIEATEEIAPGTFLVYYGEIKYISDGTICLTQNSYGNFYNHHLFYFSTATTELPENTQPLSEQRACRLSSPSIQADVSILGDAERLSNVYTEGLINSDYMYPYQKYDPASNNPPANPPSAGNNLPANPPSADTTSPEGAPATITTPASPVPDVKPDVPAPGNLPVELYCYAL